MTDGTRIQVMYYVAPLSGNRVARVGTTLSRGCHKARRCARIEVSLVAADVRHFSAATAHDKEQVAVAGHPVYSC